LEIKTNKNPTNRTVESEMKRAPKRIFFTA